MFKRAANIFSIILLFLAGALFSQDVSVDAILDTAKLRIGEQAKVDIYLSYSANKNIKVQWPSIGDTLTEKVEVVNVSPIDTTFPDKSNSTKILQHQQITISVYDSGYFAVPGFKFFVNDDTAHPLYTKPLFLEVHTVPTDSSAKKTKDIKPPFEEPFNWEWYVEYLYWGIGFLLLILIVIIITIYYARKNKDVVPEPEKPKIPAHITALASLERIRQESAWKDGNIKEYYSSISDTVRLYIEERFALNALESTTDEIMLAFRTQVVDKESKEKLQQLLMLSDLVKFAKLFPVEAEHNFTLQNAFDFVNGTKREEEISESQLDWTAAQPISKPQVNASDNKPDFKSGSNSAVNSTQQSASVSGTVEPNLKSTGKRRLLIIISCVIVFLILISLTYYFVNRLVSSGNSVDYSAMAMPAGQDATAVQLTAQLLNQQCPIMLDAENRIDSAVATSEKVLRCYTTMINLSQGQVDEEQFKEKLRANMLSLIRTSPELKGIREESGTIEYECRYKDGRQICIITISPEDYLN